MALLAWWNLIFVLPFVGALGFLLLLATGAVAAEGEADVEADVDVEADGGLEPGAFLKVLSVVGVGKVPASIILMSFCFIWGFSGWVGNSLFSSILPAPHLFIWPSLGLACGSAVLVTRYLTLGLSKIMPTVETYGVSYRQLVGKSAAVRFTVTERSGSAQLRDDYGNLQEISCRIPRGEEEMGPGESVLIVSYEKAEQAFIVCRNPLGDVDFSEPASEE